MMLGITASLLADNMYLKVGSLQELEYVLSSFLHYSILPLNLSGYLTRRNMMFSLLTPSTTMPQRSLSELQKIYIVL